MTEILVAGLALVGTLLGSWLANRKSADLIAYRLEELERKVDAHNQVIERTFHLEAQDELREEQIKVINHRIGDLEAYHK